MDAFCSACGQPVAQGTAFCGRCGAPVNIARADAATQDVSTGVAGAKRKTNKLVVVAVVVLISGLVGSILHVDLHTARANTETRPQDQHGRPNSVDPRVQLFIKRCEGALSAEGMNVQCRADENRRTLIVTSPALTPASALKFIGSQRKAAEDVGFETISFWNGKKAPDHVYTENFDVNPKKAEAARKAAKEASERLAKKDRNERIALPLAAEAAKRLREAMRNPDSFKLSQASIMDDGAVCYELRAQNGFGGMNVGQAVLSPSGQLRTNETDGFVPLWNRECTGKTGTDKTWDVGYLAGFHGVFDDK